MPKLPTVTDVTTRLNNIPLPAVPEKVVITDNSTYEQAGVLLRHVKARTAEVEAQKDVFMAPLNELRNALLDAFRPRLTQLKAMEATIKDGISEYNTMLESLRVQEEARMRDLFRNQSEEAAEKALALMAEGKDEEAEVVEYVPYMPSVVSDKPKLEGISSRTQWKHEVTNFKALVAAVAAGIVPIEYLQPNDKVLAGIASALKDATRIPGVKVYPKSIIASRGV